MQPSTNLCDSSSPHIYVFEKAARAELLKRHQDDSEWEAEYVLILNVTHCAATETICCTCEPLF